MLGHHLARRDAERPRRIKMLHVPYRAVAPAITDVIGGQVDRHSAAFRRAADGA